MTYNHEQFTEIIGDKRTVISMMTNDRGNGERVIVMSAMIRNHSPLLNKYLNPHRNMSEIPSNFALDCPRCHDSWTPVLVKRNGTQAYTHYTCSSNCGVSICDETFKRYSRGSIHIEEPVSETIPRGEEIMFGNEEPTHIEFGNEETDEIEFGSEEISQPTFNIETGEWE